MSMQMEILYDVQQEVSKKVAADRSKWLNVRDVANMYRAFYNEARLKRSAADIFGPAWVRSSKFSFEPERYEQGFNKSIGH